MISYSQNRESEKSIGEKNDFFHPKKMATEWNKMIEINEKNLVG